MLESDINAFPLIIYLMGITNSGKSTLIDTLKKSSKLFGSVEVGKVLRAKYPPDYFEGNAAPKKTEEEAMQIYKDEVRRNVNEGKKIILVDGQPRTASQVDNVFNAFPNYMKVTVLLSVSSEEAERRARARDKGNEEAIELSLQRLTRDKIQLFEVLEKLGSDRSPYIGDCIDIEERLRYIEYDLTTPSPFIPSRHKLLRRTFV